MATINIIEPSAADSQPVVGESALSRARKWLSANKLHFVLLPLAAFWLSPLFWIVITSLKSRKEVFDTAAGLLPTALQWSNYPAAMRVAPFGMYLLNSMMVTGGILACQLATITLAAYAFARLEFPGKKILFTFFLLQIMFPIYATFLTNFVTIRELGLLNTLPAMVVPFVASGYGTFMLRQAFRQVPSELADAARLDGCGHFATLWHVYLPLVQPTLVAFGIISVVTHWNDYMWPLLVTNSESVRTLPIGLGLLAKSDSGADWTRLMAATVVVVSPLLLFFLIFQRRFVDSFMHAGLK
jgi:sn-glycerol 3-phosphate transport system permease protein